MVSGKICILSLDLQNTPKRCLQRHVAETDAADLGKHISSLADYLPDLLRGCEAACSRPDQCLSDPRAA